MAETRRRILEIGASAVALGLSGCGGIDGGGDGDDNSGDGDGGDSGSDDGNDPEVSAPAVAWDFQEQEGELVIQHSGGDMVGVDSIQIRGPAESRESTADTLSAGDSITVQLANDASSEDTIRIVYQGQDGTETVIGEHTLSG